MLLTLMETHISQTLKSICVYFLLQIPIFFVNPLRKKLEAKREKVTFSIFFCVVMVHPSFALIWWNLMEYSSGILLRILLIKSCIKQKCRCWIIGRADSHTEPQTLNNHTGFPAQVSLLSNVYTWTDVDNMMLSCTSACLTSHQTNIQWGRVHC